MDDYPASEPIPNVGAYHHELMEFLVDNHEMQKAAKHSVKQGLYAGGGAVAGGLLMGPVGGLLGGIAGSVVGFLQSDNYSGIVQQVLELDELRQQNLIRSVQRVLATAAAGNANNNINLRTVEGFKQGLIELASRRQVRDQIWQTCLDAVEATP